MLTVVVRVFIVQCATYQHYSITQATFNISSDLMMLGVGIPLLLKAKVPLKKYG